MRKLHATQDVRRFGELQIAIFDGLNPVSPRIPGSPGNLRRASSLRPTTAVRFHFVEIGYSAAFRALQVTVIGGPAWVFVAYETAFQLNTLFHHSNVCLRIGIERWLNLVIVTPRMHGIHHSKQFHEINSNWSSVFSWWDRLHGTLRLNVPQSAIDIGVAGYSLPEDNTVRAVFTMPFWTQRDYWRDADGKEVPGRQGTGKQTRLAE